MPPYFLESSLFGPPANYTAAVEREEQALSCLGWSIFSKSRVVLKQPLPSEWNSQRKWLRRPATNCKWCPSAASCP